MIDPLIFDMPMELGLELVTPAAANHAMWMPRSVFLAGIAPQENASTAITRWRGEECDYTMAVEALLVRDTPHVSAETSPGMQAAGSVWFGEIRRARLL